MLAVTNSTFDLLVLQLRLHTVCGGLLLLIILLPCHARPENNVLAHRRSLETWTDGIVLLEPELCPSPSLCDLRVDSFTHNSSPDAPRSLDFFTSVVEAERYACFGTVFVGSDLGRRQDIGVI